MDKILVLINFEDKPAGKGELLSCLGADYMC